MAITLDITGNLDKVQRILKVEMEKAIVKAVKGSLSRTVVTYRKLVDEKIRTKYAIKSSEVKKDFTRIRKSLKGNRFDDLHRLEVAVDLADRPVSFIRLVRGQKTPEDQTGKRISRRRVLKIEYPRGVIKKDKSLFIARVKGGNIHVFRKIKGKWKKESAPSPHHMFVDGMNRKPIEQQVGQTLEKNFIAQLNFELDKITPAS